MNKRILKAVRQNNEFKADWLRAQRYLRCSWYIAEEIGKELQAELTTKWLTSRKAWC
jgi:hypothetical protein